MKTILKNDAVYEFTLDTSLLELGMIPLDPILRNILPSSPEKICIDLEIGEKDKVQAILDNSEDVLLLDKNGFDRLEAGQMFFKILNQKEHKYKINVPTKDNLDELTLNSNGIDLDIILVHELQNALRHGKFAQPKEHFLHTRANHLALRPGFEHLISLPMIREIEPFKHQLKTAKTVLQRMRGRALLCDEVGLGKTIEAGIIMM